jgi:hypothetical protein
MKATIEIDDELYRQVKAAAAIRGRKVKDLVAEGLRTVLRSPHAGPRARRIQLPMSSLKSREPCASATKRLRKLKRGCARMHESVGWASLKVSRLTGSPWLH